MRSKLVLILAAGLALAAACSKTKSQAQVGPSSAPPPTSLATSPSAAPAPAAAGQDFSAEARLLFRLVACGGDEPIPAGLEAVVEAHCKALLPLMERYRQRYVEGAQAFLVSLQPKTLPKIVVYPFGGGDLLSALTTYPEASEITTLSLELAGDPRRVRGIDAKRLEESLLRVRKGVSGLLALSDSTSENLMQLQRGDLPGQLSFFLIGLKIHAQEPVALRFFRLNEDGALHYMTAEDIQALEGKTAQKLNQVWKSPDFSEAFSDAEIAFRPSGAPADAPLRVHRHIAANLADGPLVKDPRVLRHLESKGRVAAMTKAASYILWSRGFSKIRDYLLANVEFMVSDSTGIPHEYAEKAGFVQETYGSFSGPFLEASMRHAEDFCALWDAQPKRRLSFRYGYPDVLFQNHLVVTRRAEARP